MFDKPLYESKKSAEIIGIPERTLRYWATTKVIIPEKDAIGRPGIRRLYSFKNLVEAAILRELSNLNVTISLASKAVDAVKKANFGNEGKDACFLIGGGGSFEIYVLEGILDELPPSELELNPETFALSLIEKDSSEEMGRIESGIRYYTTEDFKELPKKLNPFYASLIRIFLRLGASLIIPIHTLWREIEEKAKQEE